MKGNRKAITWNCQIIRGQKWPHKYAPPKRTLPGADATLQTAANNWCTSKRCTSVDGEQSTLYVHRWRINVSGLAKHIPPAAVTIYRPFMLHEAEVNVKQNVPMLVYVLGRATMRCMLIFYTFIMNLISCDITYVPYIHSKLCHTSQHGYVLWFIPN